MIVRIRAFFEALLYPFLVTMLHWLDERDPVFVAEYTRPIPIYRPWESLQTRSPVLRALRKAWARVPALVRPVLVLVSVMAVWQALMPAVIVASLSVMLIALILLMFPFLPWLWRIPFVISASLPVARETEAQRWQMLRSTPYNTLEILQALHAAATYRLVQLWAYVTVVRFVVLIVPLMIAVVAILLVLLELIIALLGGSVFQGRFTLAHWTAYVLSIAYMLAEPFIDVTVDGWLGILASTFSQIQLRAMLNGFLLRFILWGLQVLSLLLVLPDADRILTSEQVSNLPTLVLLGPAYGLLLEFPPSATIVMVLVLLALRVGGVHLFMRMAVWRAERVGLD